MKKSLIAAALVLTAVFSGTVLFAGTAEAAWPEKNITVIITHGAGGDTDFNARLMCRLLEQKLGVSVVPTNVTGSNGAIAMAQYKDGTPDGYTFLMTNTAALTGNEATGLSDYGYDAFEVVSVYAKQSGENIVVPADSPYKTLADLIEASRKNPNTIKFGVSTGGGVYIASVILEQAAGTKFAVIDEGDAASRMTALLGKHVDATIVPYAVVKEYIQAGQVRTLGTLLKEPPALLKDIPTAHESGCPELILNTLYACLAPRGTSPEIVRALNAA
ncbi:MAG: Bug family tripartite tricarboxylate transporter substrate binding protein, partial [Aminobacteriaceae bacterium]